MIRNFAGRADLFMYLDNTNNQIDQTLSYTDSAQWEDMGLFYVGAVSPGSHSVFMQGNAPNAYGCGGFWGGIDVLIVDDPRVVKFWSIKDVPAPSCPISRPSTAASPLLSWTYTQIAPDATIWINVHIIRDFK